MREVEKLTNDLRRLCFHQFRAGELAEHLTRLGYLPVEPVQLEVLGGETLNILCAIDPFCKPQILASNVSRATIARNEAGQLYRAKSGTIEDVIEGEVVNE